MAVYIQPGLNASGELGIKNDMNAVSFEKAKTKDEDLANIISIGRSMGGNKECHFHGNGCH